MKKLEYNRPLVIVELGERLFRITAELATASTARVKLGSLDVTSSPEGVNDIRLEALLSPSTYISSAASLRETQER
jgi:hypothetical protein